jgi:two-component system chemotaxis sensor kinase CheA
MALDIDIDLEAIIRTFAAECAERIAEMEEAALALEAQPQDATLVEVMFRGAHTLKGNAGSLGYTSLADFTHAMEDLLQRFRSGAAPVTRSAITLTLEALDVLRELVAEAIAGNEGLKPRHSELLRRLVDSGMEARHERPDASPGNFPEKAPDDTTRAATTPGSKHEDAAVLAGRNGTVRVDTQRLDRMLNLAGEVTIAQGRLRLALERGNSGKDACEAHEQAERLSLDLQEEILKLRMVPVGSIFRRFIRIARDVAAAAGKQARLSIEGEDAEIDLSIVEHLKDPLMHMLRNAIDHGLEAPERRVELGKNLCGLLLLKAFHDSGSIVIQLIDDGAGLNRERIIARAKERGGSTEIEKMSDREIYQLIFEPGFSTAAAVTDLSGRGVGMDVVRRNIEALRGTVQLESRPGHGVTVTVRLPLTLAIIEGFSVEVGGDTFILPLYAVLECLTLPERDRGESAFGVINLRGEPLPYIRLGHRFQIDSASGARESVVVVAANGIKAGLVVDALNGPRQTVIKPLGKRFQHVSGISGSAILGNGRVALIVDIAALLRDVQNKMPSNGMAAAALSLEEV